jgi:SseB protein C-terminal domain
MIVTVAVGVAIALLIIRFVLHHGSLPRSGAFIDFTPLRDAREAEPAFTDRLRLELDGTESVQRAYLAMANINGDDQSVLTLALRFYADVPDEALLRRLDALNTETSGGKRLIAMLPLSEYDERKIANVANPIFKR